MKMKKIISKYTILFLAGFLLAFGSCTDLQENVYDSIIAEETQFTEADLASLIAPVYVKLRNSYFGWNAYIYAMEESSDCMVIPVRIGIGWGSFYVSYHMHQWTPSHEYPENQWWYFYQVVNACNQALFQLGKLKDVEGLINYEYEIKAVRAHAYYILLDTYRNVPIVDQWEVPKGYLPEQNSAKEVYDFVEKELKEAMPYLLDKKDKLSYGRYTKWAAKMTLAKLYLNSEVYGQGARYNDAITQVNDIIASGLYTLAANPLDPFSTNNEDNSEAIFAIPLDETNVNFYAYPARTLNGASGPTFDLKLSSWGGTGMIPQFIDTYDPDDERLGAYVGGPQVTYKGEPLMLSDGTQLNYTNYMTSVYGAEKYEGWRCVKYQIRLGLNQYPGNDLQYFRYTDALMIKAECLLRTGNADGAAEIVTNIRKRCFTDNPGKASVTGAELVGGSSYEYGNLEGSTMSNYQGGADIQYGRFLDELGWEFVFEARRKQDLIRFGVYTTKRWLSHVPNGDHRKIFPIPQSAMEANPNLVQNPGY
jgi:starch-binding outer membrane protein, SusD/RagB family